MIFPHTTSRISSSAAWKTFTVKLFIIFPAFHQLKNENVAAQYFSSISDDEDETDESSFYEVLCVFGQTKDGT